MVPGVYYIDSSNLLNNTLSIVDKRRTITITAYSLAIFDIRLKTTTQVMRGLQILKLPFLAGIVKNNTTNATRRFIHGSAFHLVNSTDNSLGLFYCTLDNNGIVYVDGDTHLTLTYDLMLVGTCALCGY